MAITIDRLVLCHFLIKKWHRRKINSVERTLLSKGEARIDCVSILFCFIPHDSIIDVQQGFYMYLYCVSIYVRTVDYINFQRKNLVLLDILVLFAWKHCVNSFIFETNCFWEKNYKNCSIFFLFIIIYLTKMTILFIRYMPFQSKFSTLVKVLMNFLKCNNYNISSEYEVTYTYWIIFKEFSYDSASQKMYTYI